MRCSPISLLPLPARTLDDEHAVADVGYALVLSGSIVSMIT